MDNELIKLSNTFKKYNLGCGTLLYEGFLNIGYWDNLGAGVIYKNFNSTHNTFMLNHDLCTGIPAEDNSLELIYHCHMLEHINYNEGIEFIRECFRTLKSGGKMRIVVPDLEVWVNAYTSNNNFFLSQYRKVLDSEIHQTKASIFMGMLHGHDHKCGYDFESLEWLLNYIGFSNIDRTLYADGSIENIQAMEPMNPLRVMESLCVECTKP